MLRSAAAQVDKTGNRFWKSATRSITNTQTEGVDQGGIVKLHGNHLVILRRGRLFTIDIADRSLRPIAWVNAYGPGTDPSDTWYDEMLVHGDRIVVIGYSYERGGTELVLFDIDSNGLIRYEPARSLFAGACSDCSVTSSSKAGSRAVASSRTSE